MDHGCAGCQWQPQRTPVFSVGSKGEHAEYQRTRIRQRGILRAEPDSDPISDEDDWQPTYDADLVGWLWDTAETLKLLGHPHSLIDILETDHRYPGLFEDLFLHLWQYQQIKELMKDNGDG